jgi:rRNA-processing protein FCF1
MKYALDTNTITYYLKGNKKILDKVDQEAKNDNIIIPPFVYFEIKKWLMSVNSNVKLQAFDCLRFSCFKNP